MAVAFTLPTEIDRITLSATADNVTKVTLQKNAKRLLIQGIGVAVKLALTGTDGAAIGSDYWTIPAGAALEIHLDRSDAREVYLASATTSAVVEVMTWRI